MLSRRCVKSKVFPHLGFKTWRSRKNSGRGSAMVLLSHAGLKQILRHLMLRSSPHGTFVLTSWQVDIRTSCAFKSLWSEQDGHLTFLHKIQRHFKLIIYKMMNVHRFFLFLFNLWRWCKLNHYMWPWTTKPVIRVNFSKLRFIYHLIGQYMAEIQLIWKSGIWGCKQI